MAAFYRLSELTRRKSSSSFCFSLSGNATLSQKLRVAWHRVGMSWNNQKLLTEVNETCFINCKNMFGFFMYSYIRNLRPNSKQHCSSGWWRTDFLDPWLPLISRKGYLHLEYHSTNRAVYQANILEKLWRMYRELCKRFRWDKFYSHITWKILQQIHRGSCVLQGEQFACWV